MIEDKITAIIPVRKGSTRCKNKNIRVNCISPGGIKNNQPNSFLKKYKNDCVSKGMLDPFDLNGVLLMLLSDDTKYLTGQNIIIDDGWSL